MGIVRNGIEIQGITPENELPAEISGQLIELSEAENILIDKDIKIKKLHKINVDMEIKGNKIITAPLSRIFVVDGYKRLKISYYDRENNIKNLELKRPFNIFFDVENNRDEVDEMRLHIADAYFELSGSRTLYCCIIYMADIRYLNSKREKQETVIRINGQNDSEINPRQETAVLEMSISKEKKGEIKEAALEEDVIAESLIDIEAEYL